MSRRVKELKQRDTAERPIKRLIMDDGYYWTYYFCPICDSILENDGTERFCSMCGQRLQWEKEIKLPEGKLKEAIQKRNREIFTEVEED